jgi:sugar phosphate isomerase/epimerase
LVPYDLLLKQTNPELVQMEMDIGWVVAGGADPLAYLTKYPNRYYSLHIKDLKNQEIPNTEMKMVSAIIGKGMVDWKVVLAAARKTRVERAFLEIEEPYVPSPLEMVRESFDYLHGHI